MKTVLAIIAGLLVAVVAAVLIIPSFIDWNQRKPEIVSLVKNATGRDMELRGDISVSILPAPALKVDDVRIANIEGAASADMVALKSLEVRVALFPLISGNIQVQSVKVVEPVVDIQLFADGRTNLSFSPPDSTTTNATPSTVEAPTSSPTGSATPAIAIDNLVIERGSIIFRDDAKGSVERIENLNGTFNAASLSGPLESTGSLVVRNIPLSYRLSVGAIIQGRTVPLSVAVEVIPGEVTARLTGVLAGLVEEPRFKGEIKIEGEDLAAFAGAVSGGALLSNIFARPFSLGAEVSASQSAANIDNLEVSLADIRGGGKIEATLGDVIDANVEMTINRLDINGLLNPPARPQPESTDDAAVESSRRVSKPIAPAIAVGSDSAAPSTFELPTNINLSVNLNASSVSYRDGLVSDVKVDALLNAGEVTINQVSAQLPGGSDLAAFGFVTVDGGRPIFDGNMDMSTNDLRSVLKWLGVEPPAAAADRLRQLAFAGKVGADSSEIRLSEIDLKVDNTRVKGAATVALRERLAVGANVVIDKINIDPYLGASPKAVAKGDNRSAAAANSAPVASVASAGTPMSNPLLPLTALTAVDANLKARIGSMTLQGIPMKNVDVDATSFDGIFTLRNLSVGDAAGVVAKLEGAVTDLSGVKPDPKFQNMAIDIRSKNLGRFLKLADINLPVSANQLGSVALSGTINGAPSELDVDLTAKAARGEYGIKGKVAAFGVLPALDAGVRVTHPDIQRLLRLAGVEYSTAKRLGKIDVQAQVKGTPLNFTLSDITGAAAGVSLAGDLKGSLVGTRPKLVANLQTGAIRIDRFLPVKRRANLNHPAFRELLHQASWRLPAANDNSPLLHRVATTADGRWPTDAIDLSALNLLDADINLRSQALSFDAYRLENLELVAALKSGVLTANRLVGQLFGGALTAGGRVASDGANGQYAMQLNVQNLNLPQAMKALGSSALRAGRMTLAADVTSSGQSVASLVSALAGQGRVDIKGIDPGAGGAGSMLAPITGLLQPLSALGGRQAKGLADASTSFRIDKGVASFNDFKLESGVGSGSAAGTIDLPAWQIKSKGEVRMDQSLLVALLAQRTKLPQVLPFEIVGRLDAPNVKLETGKTDTGGIAIPGLDNIRKKQPGVGAVIDQLIPGILGGGQAAPAPQSSNETQQQESVPSPAPQQQEEKPQVDDLIKGILRGLGR